MCILYYIYKIHIHVRSAEFREDRHDFREARRDFRKVGCDPEVLHPDLLHPDVLLHPEVRQVSLKWGERLMSERKRL